MDDGAAIPETPEIGDYTIDGSDQEKELASLQTYLDQVPYDCETTEEMNAKLEEIVAKLMICVETKNWLVLTSWDGMLQCWLLMRYPMTKPIRAKLVLLYYELTLAPGIEPRILRSWADMLSRLISNKPGYKRKLEATDLELQWQPLWRALQKELWPKARMQDSSRNVINILLFVGEQVKRYFPASEIPDMLDTFVPLLTKEAGTALTMIPVMTSFLPPTHIHLYLPLYFKLWQAFNSSIIDDRLVELVGELAEEHVAGTAGLAGPDGGAQWKDVGIFTQSEWTFLVGKALGSMNIPIGSTRGASATASHADTMGDKQSLRIKKATNRCHALAKLFVYSISVDGEVRPTTDVASAEQTVFLASSRALDSLEKTITSTETFFHPSNFGLWTMALTAFVQYLTSEFGKRCSQEAKETCKTPLSSRITPEIRQEFVKTLRTPCLLAMFSKDPICSAYAQSALRCMAHLEPELVMPDLLQRAYDGLEVVNETHRTTAVLSMLTGMVRPLATESLWLGGQKHLVPLLTGTLAGIDLNDPVKTVCATMFIVASVQHIKIGDISETSVVIDDNAMDVDSSYSALPAGSEQGFAAVLSKAEERALARDSAANFADWVTSLFRRVFALYENLPEEGGKRNITGGKQEEGVLKSIKNMLDVVCMHLSDSLFDLVLKLVYDYATTNAKSNAVRAFGQLTASLARVRPEQTIAKFLPFCIMQIKDELEHGASSIRTTSSHTAVPSDTTLHWNMAILRGCLGYGSSSLVKRKKDILELLSVLTEKTKSERGYSGTGRMITRILHTLAGVYPLNGRFLNTEEWENPDIDLEHNIHWGKLYEAKDVKLEWHVPSLDETQFVLDILHKIASPALDKIEEFLNIPKWDSVTRNDFCRYLHAVRSIWSGLPTFILETHKETPNPCINVDTESSGLLVSHLDVKAGFTLTNPRDPRYHEALVHRTRFGTVIKRAASILSKNSEGEDHIDAVIAVNKAIDVYLLEYGMSRSSFDSLQKSYVQARELNRAWPNQKENSRLVYAKRAQLYHSGRVYLNALYRRRSALDDLLLRELAESCLSPYTRVRRHAQAVLHNVCGYYVRATRFILPIILEALVKGNEADRMKGALYVLWNKGAASYALSDEEFHGKYIISLLECQHEEKPSIQKLVNDISNDCLTHLHEEAFTTLAYTVDTSRIDEAIKQLQNEFSPLAIDKELLADAQAKTLARINKRTISYNETVSSILAIANKSQTHWRYVTMACKFLMYLLRRDVEPSEGVTDFLMRSILSPQLDIRNIAQRAICKILVIIKMRTFARSEAQLWFEELDNPLKRIVPVANSAKLLADLESSLDSPGALYVDRIQTGFLTWSSSLKAYLPVNSNESPFVWETNSQPSLQVIRNHITKDDFYEQLSTFWSQESNKEGVTLELRSQNVYLAKSLAKMFERDGLESLLKTIDPLLSDSDKFKQRAGAEFLSGILRGAKHWPSDLYQKMWSWTMSRLDRIFAQIKPDTLPFWESLINWQLSNRDPRRHECLIKWILSLSLEFSGDSAFAMTKNLTMFTLLPECLGMRFNSKSKEYIKLMLDNANTGYAEIRGHIAQNLQLIIRNEWLPSYSSTTQLLTACREAEDPLFITQAKYSTWVLDILQRLPKWRTERLPPPRVSQSEYDKVGLTLLTWIWVTVHGPQASLILSYAVPMMPEIVGMSELNDSTELQAYSSAVLYALSAISLPKKYVEIILQNFIFAIKSSSSWRIRRHVLPALVVFYFRNLFLITPTETAKIMEILVECLGDENVEVREMAAKMFSSVVRCSQRHQIVSLRDKFLELVQTTELPPRRDDRYGDALRKLHSGVLGICALIESFPYSPVESWMPPLTEVLANHSTDPPPISTTIRKCASEFKKTHQDTWHKDQRAFDDEQLQDLSTMLVGTSYYA